jgi:predicted dehydrogenase
MLVAVLLLVVSVVACGCASGASPGGSPPAVSPAPVRQPAETGPLRVAVIGMVHGHVEGILARSRDARGDVQIVGCWEPDRAVFDRLAAKYKLDPALYHADLGRMLDETRPEAASVMTSIADHVLAVEACAPRGVHVLLEKPLAFTNADARRMADLAGRHGVHVLTNYETSWYASVRHAKQLVESGHRAPVRRMVFRHGHRGPREIGCSPEFLAWLTDPRANGGGAIVDFGCYGAVLATWLMDGRRPDRVVASTAQLKPGVYPHVDDDATIVLTYPGATAVIGASWAWTHDNKEMDVHTERGSIHAGKWDELTIRDPDKPAAKVPAKVTAAARPGHLQDEWVYLREVVRGRCAVDPLSSLELNLVAVEILDAARASAKAGQAGS